MDSSETAGLVVMSDSTRLGYTKRFLAKPPEMAVKLVATMVTETPRNVEEWPIDKVKPAIADEIMALLNELVIERRTTVRLLLTYVDELGSMVGPSRELVKSLAQLGNPGSMAVELDGTERASMKLAQASSLEHTKLYIQAHATQLQHAMSMQTHVMEMVQQLMDRASEAELRARKAEEREYAARQLVLAEMEELHATLREERASTDAPSPGVERAMKIIEAIMPQIVGRLLAPPAAPVVRAAAAAAAAAAPGSQG